MRPLYILAACVSLAVPAWAHSESIKPAFLWPQEPSAFLGVDLHGDFLQQVEPCVDSTTRPTTLCRVATDDPTRFEIRGLPYLPISPGYSLVARVADGQVSELVFSGNANSLYLVTEMLTERFGEPGEQQSHWIKMNSGASYLAEVMRWTGEKVTIDFKRQENDLGRYAVTISPTLPTTAQTASTAEAPTEAIVPEVSNL